MPKAAHDDTLPTHALQETLLRTITDQLPAIVTDILASKAAAQGFRLSAEQRQALHSRVVARDFSDFELPGRTPAGVKELKLRWTSRDSRKLESAGAKLMKQLPRLIEAESALLAKDFLRRCRQGWRDSASLDRHGEDAFRLRLARRWRRPFDT
jgi:hypothetical protein